MKPYRLYIVDFDGTLFRGDEAVPHALDALKGLRDKGALVRFLTNNSRHTREYYTEKLRGMGFAIDVSEIYTSAMGAAHWLNANDITSVFIVGEEGLADTLEAAGIEIVNRRAGEVTGEISQKSQAVVAGICRGLTYRWINAAMQQILSGARFIATNPDTTYPVEGGKLVPGAGAIVASIRACSGSEPIVIGKPNPYLIDMILADTGVTASETLVVGDRVDTDLEAGKAAGCDTLLVLTGVTSEPVEGYASAEDLRVLMA